MKLQKASDSLTQVKNALFLAGVALVAGGPVFAQSGTRVDLGWKIPTLGQMLTFVIRLFFVIAGLMALLYLLLGALAWVTSGGNKENVEKAREKIQAAIIGVILIVLVLSIVWTLEQIVFQQKICMGISCDVTIPSLIQP